MTDKEKIEMLAESNMYLSYLLSDGTHNKKYGTNKISYLFGRPLNEIYDMILREENKNEN